MKRFVLRCLCFALVVSASAAASFGLNAALFASLPYRAPRGTRTLLAGDSRAAHGLDPDEISGAVAIAMRGEGLALTLTKVRHALHFNPQVTSVVVTVSPLNVAASNDDPFPAGWETLIARRYFALVNPLTHPGLRLPLSARIRQFVRWRLTPSLRYARGVVNAAAGVAWRPPAFADGFMLRRGLRRTLDVPDGLLRRRFGDGNGAVSASSVAALRAIVDAGATRGCHVLLVRMPIHANYRERIPPRMEAAFSAVIAGIPPSGTWDYVDLSRLDLPDANFYDWDHLNVGGARAVSRLIAARLDRGR